MDQVYVARANPKGVPQAPHETSYLTQSEMEDAARHIRDNPMPVYVEHTDSSHVEVGRTVSADVMKSGELAVAFKLHPEGELPQLARELIRTGEMRDVSLGWDVGVERAPQGHIKRVLYKRPHEISIVRKGDRDGTSILGTAAQLYKSVASAQARPTAAMSTPAPAAAPTTPAAPVPAATQPRDDQGRFAEMDKEFDRLVGVAQPAQPAAAAAVPQESEKDREIRLLKERLAEHDRARANEIVKSTESEEVQKWMNELAERSESFKAAQDKIREIIKRLQSVPTAESAALATMISAAASAHATADRLRATELEQQVRVGQKRERQLEMALNEIKRLKEAAAPAFAQPHERVAALASRSAAAPAVQADPGIRVPANPRDDPFFGQILNAYGYARPATDAQYERDFRDLYEQASRSTGAQGTWAHVLAPR